MLFIMFVFLNLMYFSIFEKYNCYVFIRYKKIKKFFEEIYKKR